ncbi:protein UNUSUAL FLORAL ORGANS-like [Momordica charantia]|uniref:Protein UNUSUAL FLORAL ORGANS-like n=1 Tax=Momordica charantia TaxID=3673 RepID=A0A6J1DL72_MOMCH|nr:protein UNUSUAL FLORAL ORGANS-like [Momordica charantia]
MQKLSLFPSTMWSGLPLDLLANIFSFLSPDSLARARSACKHWHECVDTRPSCTEPISSPCHPSWFIALPLRAHKLCFAHNPLLDNWHRLSLEFLPELVKSISPVGSLLLLRSISSVVLQLVICNPFTCQFQYLPKPNIARTNPAVGVVIQNTGQNSQFPDFMIYVAGGMSEAPKGGTMYESKLEMYDSRNNSWRIVGSMPVEFSVRLTVWTQNESVYSNGVLYWITSARAFSVMGFEIDSNICRELQVPMADRLEFASLTCRNGRLALVGGICGEDACVWELGDGDMWVLVETVPNDLGIKLLGGCNRSWINTKCVGNNEVMCLYKELGSGMVIWREIKEINKREWVWVEGCSSIRGKRVHNLPIKGLLLHPSLAPFASYSNYTP